MIKGMRKTLYRQNRTFVRSIPMPPVYRNPPPTPTPQNNYKNAQEKIKKRYILKICFASLVSETCMSENKLSVTIQHLKHCPEHIVIDYMALFDRFITTTIQACHIKADW